MGASRSIKDSLKRQCSKPYSYCTSSSPYYPHTFVSANYFDLLILLPPNTDKLPGQQVGEIRNCRAVHSQTVRNMTTKHNPALLPIDLYAVAPPDVQPCDLTKLGDHHSLQHMPQKEVTVFLYTSNQIVCVKDDRGGSEITLIIAAYQRMLKLA